MTDTLGYLESFDWSDTPIGAREGWPPSLEAIYSMMLASPLSMCATWGAEQTLLYNAGYAPFLAQRHPAALGRPLPEVWSDVWNDIGPLVERVFAGEAVSFVDMHLVMTRNGYEEDTWWSFAYSPLRERGQVMGILNVATETTAGVAAARQRDAAERELRVRNATLESEIVARRDAAHRFARLIEHLPVGICYLDVTGQLVLRNPVFEKFLPDYPESFSTFEKRGRRWQGFDAQGEQLAPEDYPDARALRGELVTPGEEFLLFRDDDSAVWVSISAVPLVNRDEEPAGILLVLDDIDQRKRLVLDLERRVALRSADRNALWTLSSDIMLRCTHNGTITAINPAWTAVLGWREHELLGSNLIDLIHPDDVASTISGARDLAQGNSLQRFDNRYRHVDGSYRWISWSARPFENMINAVGRDITLEKERVAELEAAQMALRQSQKMEAVGQLTGGLAHDFNNLLQGITGALQLIQLRMQQGRLDDLERFVATGMGAARRAAALTHRLLAFSRRQTLSPTIVDVNRLVADMQELIQRSVGPSIHVAVVCTSDAWAALVDGSQLENALLNLCLNARDAMPDGGRITIETANQRIDERAAGQKGIMPGEYLSLCVTDTGTGMSTDIVARAFEPFFTTKPLGQGTGLGLSMIYGFAQQSGGQVRINSEVGHGTTVCIYLPRHDGEGVANSAADSGALAPLAQPGRPATVLVVDDEPTVRSLVIEILKDLGLAWIEASDSTAGLNLLQSTAHIDLLISDVGLPGGMNGRQMADAGRTSRPGLPVLFITGYAENAFMSNESLEPGMAVLTKPFSMQAMAASIEAMMKIGPQSRT
ncbi:PAS domain S-box-containing protein [Pseudoduganella lurida]|uniref:histidine kinase n=1 Tax=Pseudoduganella lurida TaxID=1036180 RepID=A0A562RLE5_9BURK|nr:PAS domain-containing protein [Pseudoduganella lurida]TWI69276.1 PAS domain S-box-containing protein [Pseudoduganella lurida]